MAIEVYRPRTINRWLPFSPIEEMESLLEPYWPLRLVWWRAPRDGMAWAPSIDMYEKEDVFMVRAELPGVKMEDVDISMTGDTLTIKGERKAPTDVKEDEYQ
jgi:HSP20 family protein